MRCVSPESRFQGTKSLAEPYIVSNQRECILPERSTQPQKCTVHPTLVARCLIYSAPSTQNPQTELTCNSVLGCYFVHALPDFPNGYRSVCITSNTIQRIWGLLNGLEVSDRGGSSEASCFTWEPWDRVQNLTCSVSLTEMRDLSAPTQA